MKCRYIIFVTHERVWKRKIQTGKISLAVHVKKSIAYKIYIYMLTVGQTTVNLCIKMLLRPQTI